MAATSTPFKSPPRHDASSSPFPTLDEIRSSFTKPSRELENGVRSPWDDTPQPTTHAASFLATKQSPIDLVTPARLCTEPIHDDENEQDSVQVIRIPAPGTKKGRRKAGSGKLREAKPKQPKPPKGKEAPEDKPWMKYKASESPESESKKAKTATDKGKGKTRKMEEVRSHYFSEAKSNKKPSKSNRSKADQAQGEAPEVVDVEEPLGLPLAARRRVDWTPPPSEQLITIGSASSDIRELLSSTAKHSNNDASKEVFGDFLAKYGREEERIEAAVAGCLEGIPEIFKKRKQIEAVPDDRGISGADASPTKKPPKKKKPRTITEVAMAAYAKRDEPEQEPPTASILQYVQQQATEGDAKGPKKSSRKPTRTKKGRQESPEPVLLSPNAAIREVSNQDFVFGTSSQLAMEKSPTVLRNLQTALRLSAEEACETGDPFAIPLSSDPVEPKPRRKLWEVGARDEDGGLLDVEVIDLIDKPMADSPLPDDDPFGYVGDGQRAVSQRIDDSSTTDDESFPEVDILSRTAAGGSGVKGVWDENSVSNKPSIPPRPPPLSAPSSPSPSSSSAPRDPSRPSTSTAARATTNTGSDMTQLCTPPYSGQALGPPQASVPAVPATQKQKQNMSSKGPGPTTQTSRAAANPGVPPKPKYDLYTDSQLSREITSYGFKPVKRRAAMLALLDQCWESKHRARVALTPLPSNQSLSTTSQQQHKGAAAADEPAKVTLTQPPEKRPRGRPRKDGNAPKSTAEDPEPKAKAGSGAKASVPDAKTTTTTAATRRTADSVPPAAPKRRAPSKAKAQPIPAEVIEIPDSASDSSAALTCSPEGSFSSPGDVDVPLSLDEGTETSLVSGGAAADQQQQAALMGYITRAVTEAAPSRVPSQPSWHEKILMYDPVILEDLAAWLNSGQLTRVGYDGEVSPWEVKQWCEARSVCCLWRVNLSGKERKRF